jgi:hypothetical protein
MKLKTMLEKLKVPDSYDHIKLAEECLNQNDYAGAVVEYRFAAQEKNEPQIQEKITSLTGKASQQALSDSP